MKKTAYFAPLIALAAHIDQSDSPLGSVENLPFFRGFTPATDESGRVAGKVAGYANLVEHYADLLRNAPASSPVATLVELTAMSVGFGLRAFLASAGCPTDNLTTVLREVGRLVVKNAFPRPLCMYAAGGMGDFSAHRLPLANYVPGAHIASDAINTQSQLAAALRSARKCQAILTRQEVQDSPARAIRCATTGKPLTKWRGEHWQQITWRLGYTTIFDVLSQVGEVAREDASQQLPPASLRPALERIVSYCSTVFSAYLPAHAVALAA